METDGTEVELGKREVGGIAFPYADLDSAVEVARALYQRAGAGDCEIDELAAELDMTVSGGFRVKAAAARMFGFISKATRSAYRLTDLGRSCATDDGNLNVRVAAFLNVQLYSALYDRYRGQKLPPARAIEKEMMALGVPAKQADRARQVFDRSAQQAGFFQDGHDRLVRPRLLDEAGLGATTKVTTEADNAATAAPPVQNTSRGLNERISVATNPFVQGLVEQLPSPGSTWEARDRAKWIRAAISVFDLVYDAEDPRPITVSIMKGDDDG